MTSLYPPTPRFLNENLISESFSELLGTRCWLCSDSTKKPFNPYTQNSSWGDASKLCLFEEIADYIQAHPEYRPCLVPEAAGLLALDFDEVSSSEASLPAWLKQIVEELGSYAERSQSGQGVHIILKTPAPGRQVIGRIEGCKVEFLSNHPVTLTGDIIDSFSEIKQANKAFIDLYQRCFHQEAPPSNLRLKSPPLSDEAIIRLCKQAANSEKFQRLYCDGNIAEYQNDESAADLALLSLLAFYTQNPDQIDNLFRQSKLSRAKWLEREDYRRMTIEKAVIGCNEYYQPKSITYSLKTVGFGTFLTSTIKPKPLILEPILREQDIQLIYAPAGVGKTHLTLNMAYAIATGGEFLSFSAPTPRRVLVVDGEMPSIQLQERLAMILKTNKEIVAPSDENLQLLISSEQEFGLPYLDDIESQKLFQPFFDNADVIFLDNLSALTSIAEQDAKTWLPIQQLLVRLRRQGKTVILIHHSGKNGDFRGTSRAIGVVDTVINLSHPKDYEMREGLRFELRFQKARGVFGEAVDPLDIRATERNGSFEWTWQKLEEHLDEKIKELIELGMKDSEIIDELEIGRATYYRHKKKLSA